MANSYQLIPKRDDKIIDHIHWWNHRNGAGSQRTINSVRFRKHTQNVPELARLDYQIDIYSFQPLLDSSNMNPEVWIKLVNIIEEKYNMYDGFVILHGSDTMAYSASALSFMLGNLTKPVVFTGSQLPIGEIHTDAKKI